MLVDGVHRTVLDNGLKVLLKESHRAPVASFWIWYQVGSRNEPKGMSGISHWVEHMMFRGTERFPQGVADRLVARVGGYHNAMTYLDWTAYFQTLPSQYLDLALQLESDRMLNARFTPEDVELERTVIISERQGSENYPIFLLQEELLTNAFPTHPYGHMTIGWQEDLENITRDQLYQHYRAYYTPSSAVVVAVGDFDANSLSERIADLFRPMHEAVSGALPSPLRESAGPSGNRVQVSGPGDTSYVIAAYPSPPATHPDFFPLAVASTILGGARSMSLFDGGEPSRTVRLYKALVDSGLASEVSSYLLPTLDPYVLWLSATVQGDHEPSEIETVLRAELDRLAVEPVTQAELQRSVHQTRAQFVYSAESVTDQGYWLGFAESIASLQWLSGFLDSLSVVTAEDVLRVSRTYLAADRAIVGTYLPKD